MTTKCWKLWLTKVWSGRQNCSFHGLLYQMRVGLHWETAFSKTLQVEIMSNHFLYLQVSGVFFGKACISNALYQQGNYYNFHVFWAEVTFTSVLQCLKVLVDFCLKRNLIQPHNSHHQPSEVFPPALESLCSCSACFPLSEWQLGQESHNGGIHKTNCRAWNQKIHHIHMAVNVLK